MGLDPYREEHNSIGDYVLMVLALAVVVGLVVWAVVG
jgi:hypothetical protein